MNPSMGKPLFDVTGIVAVITGGGTGIGLMMARTLAANGAHKVYIIGRRESVLQEAVSESSTAFRNTMIPLVGDVTSRDDLRRMARHVEDEVGYVNLVVANAGTPGPRIKALAPDCSVAEFADFCMDIPMEDFNETFNVNTTAAFYTSVAFMKLLDAGNKATNFADGKVKSQVITTGSIAAFSRLRGAGFAYNSSKAAANHLMKLLSTYLAPHRIRCNTLAPGLIETELAGPVLKNFDPTSIPVGRLGDEDDIAGTILYAASRAGAYLNGNTIVLDGGRLGVLPSTY